jgi:endothelin-converting enzyme
LLLDIVDSFKDSLEDLEWMDKKSAKAAAEKADALAVKVGYPLSPDTLSARSIYYYYNLVKGKPDDFFGNVISAEESDVYKMWQKLGKRRDRDEWLMWPSMVNAYYNPPGNEIVFPAGILQPPFFSKDWYVLFAFLGDVASKSLRIGRPGYLSYGAFGMVAAHELTHAFDSAGRLYNQQGKLEEWWTKKTAEGFRERQECIAEQYSSQYLTVFISFISSYLSLIRVLRARPRR